MVKKINPKKTTKKLSKKKVVKKVTKKSSQKLVKKPVKKVLRKRKNQKNKPIVLNQKPHKYSDEEIQEVLNVLRVKNDVRGFVTFGEILNLIPYPELNIKGLDHVFNVLMNDNVTITKNLDVLEVDKDLSVEELVRSTSLEE
ncbi:MAG: hypothetical protein WC483_06135 [Candidatus Paceibacterota bacterium]|nr:hypothetical protein [Candidatus Paceibacterota bacterium]